MADEHVRVVVCVSYPKRTCNESFAVSMLCAAFCSRACNALSIRFRACGTAVPTGTTIGVSSQRRLGHKRRRPDAPSALL